MVEDPTKASGPLPVGRRAGVDFVLLFAVLALLGIGTLMVFSASAADSLAQHGSPYYFIERQLIWAGLGVGVLLAVSRIDYWRYVRWSFPLFVLAAVMLLAVLVPGVGKEVLGARRWIGVGSLVIQPSELAKLAMVIFFARLFSLHRDRLGRLWTGVMPHILLAGVIWGLILAEPDLGTTIACAATFFVMLFVAGARLKHLAGIGLAGVPVLGWAMLAEPYRRQRVLAFLDPWKHPLSYGFHTIQALLALGSGGIFGAGIGGSRQAFGFLPEDYTDFIFAILGEELGLIGTLLVVALFMVVTWRGYRIAMRAPDTFSSLLAAGITTMIAIQAVINIGVVTATLPVTGITLPFISYGGSSLVLSLAGVGILLNISRHTG